MTGIAVLETSGNLDGMNLLMNENCVRVLTANKGIDAFSAALLHSVFGRIATLARAFQEMLQEAITTEPRTWLRSANVVVPTK